MKVDREVLREDGQAEEQTGRGETHGWGSGPGVAGGAGGAEGRRRNTGQARLSGPLWLQALSACEPVFLALD